MNKNLSTPRTLGVFAKAPEPGHVKTRLAASLETPDAAGLVARLYGAFQQDLVARLSSFSGRKVLCWTETSSGTPDWRDRLLDDSWVSWQQPEGHLGIRLDMFFAEQPDAVYPTVVIGTDSPNLPVSLIESAFETLENHDAVVGPAFDGGYYLIGFSAYCAGLFHEINWSSRQVLDQTRERLVEAGLSVAALPPWYDVDGKDELRFLASHLQLQEQSGAGRAGECPQTFQLLMSEFVSAGLLSGCVSND